MVFVIVGLAAVAVFLAMRSPEQVSGTTENLGPNTNIPSLGATDHFSPAISGGKSLTAHLNGQRLLMTYQNAPNMVPKTRLSAPVPGTVIGIKGGFTDADSSLLTQNVPPLVASTTNVNPMLFQPIKY